MTTSREKFVGIDVAKDKLDIAVLGEKKASQVGNDEVGIATLIKELQKLNPELIVVEATGGYQRAVVLGLYEAGLPVALVNPSRVRQYARASGLLAKTDKLDAFNLAEFGKQMKPRKFEAKSEGGRYVSDLLVRRRQLEEMLKAEKKPPADGSAQDARVSGTDNRDAQGRDQTARKGPGRVHERERRLAGRGTDPDECQGSGTDHRHNLAGRTARTRQVGQEEDRRLGGVGTHERGQWQEAWLSQDEGRESRSA